MNLTGPGKVTIELAPPKKSDPWWKILVPLWKWYFFVVITLKVLSWLIE